MSDFVALSMSVNLNTYFDTQHDVTIQMKVGGVPTGDVISINDYIDTGEFAAQQLTIPMTDFNLAVTFINGLQMTCVRSGGAKPSVDFDDIQLETGSAPLVFKAAPANDEVYLFQAIRFAMADDETGVLTDVHGPALSYNKLMSISKLTNGIVFQVVLDSEVHLQLNIKQIADFMSVGFDINNYIADGTNSFVSLEVNLFEPIRLDGAKGDHVSFTIQDDLSSLLQCTAGLRGSFEEITT